MNIFLKIYLAKLNYLFKNFAIELIIRIYDDNIHITQAHIHTHPKHIQRNIYTEFNLFILHN